MTYPVFASGDVLNASDMNAVGGWLVTSAAFTTTTGFNLPTGSFSSTYTNYRLMIRITATATDTDITGRLRLSGTNATGSDYDSGMVGLTSSGTTSNSADSGATSWSLGESDSVAQAYALTIDFYGPALAQRTIGFAQLSFINKAGSDIYFRQGGLQHRLSTAYDSFAFISTQNITGRYWLYGYRD